MLAPRLASAAARAALAETFRRQGRVRVPDAFREAEAARWLGALQASEHRPLFLHDPRAPGYQVWRFAWQPGEDACDHPLCELGRWVHGDALPFLEAVTGLELRPERRELTSDSLAKGTFWDAYDEGGGGAALALQIQLAPAAWPASWGGHMELLAGPDGPLVERVPPAWNALDLYDVRRPGAWRRLPLIVKHLDGFVVAATLAG